MKDSLADMFFFYLAIVTYGKDWKKVYEIVKTKTGSQVRSDAQKFFNRLLE
jgi:SHAQKYF class myb-like DNA-binding protein